MLHSALPTGWQEHLLPDRADPCSTRAQDKGSQRPLPSDPGAASLPAGRAQGACTARALGYKDEGLSAEQDMQASCFSALCDLSQATLSFGQAEPAGLKEEQMCRANLHSVLVQPQTAGN